MLSVHDGRFQVRGLGHAHEQRRGIEEFVGVAETARGPNELTIICQEPANGDAVTIVKRLVVRAHDVSGLIRGKIRHQCSVE
jgi:hypothetical protein